VSDPTDAAPALSGSGDQSDPTALSTAQLMREIKHLRELMESRLDQVNARFDEQALAVKVALASMQQAVGESEASVARRLEALDRLTDSKFVTHRTLLESQADKVALALAAADKAVSKAELMNETRFAAVNEFRQTLTDQASNFVNRDQFEALRASSLERIRELAARIDRGEGHSGGMQTSWTYLVGAIGAIVVIVNLVIYVVTR